MLPHIARGLYFVTPATPNAPARYHLLAGDGRTVVSVQASRPDGTEVPRPAALQFNLQPWYGGNGSGHRRPTFQPAPGLATRTLKCHRCGERKLASTFPLDPSGRRLRCRECTVERNTRNGTRMRRVAKAAA